MSPTIMSLLYSSDGDQVDFSAISALDDLITGTVLVWCYPTSNTDRQHFVNHQFGASGVGEVALVFRGDQPNDPWIGQRQRGATYLTAQANAGQFASYALNKWLFFGFSFNTGGANSDQLLCMGDINTPATAPASYATQTVGSGIRGSNHGSLRIGNNYSNTTREFKGRIAWCGIWNVHMTVAQMEAQRNGRHFDSGLLANMVCGKYGTSSYDLINGLTGSVTGAVNAPHLRLGRPM